MGWNGLWPREYDSLGPSAGGVNAARDAGESNLDAGRLNL